MNIRTPQSGSAARIAKNYLKSQGVDIKHSQALELVARLHGYTDNQAMQADPNFQDPLALVAESSTEFKMVTPRQSSIYVTVENISVYIKRDDEGVSVDLFPLNHEMDDSIGSTWATYDEARQACDKCGSLLDEEGYCTDETCPFHDWPQSVSVDDMHNHPTQYVEHLYGVTKRKPVEASEAQEVVLYHFEAKGEVADRQTLESLPEEVLATEWLSKQLQWAVNLGFTMPVKVYLSECDGQGDEDITVFVCVELKGPKGMSLSREKLSHELPRMLSDVANHVCLDKDGQDVVGPDNWMLTLVDEL